MISKGSGYAVVLASDGSLWSWGEEPNGWPVWVLQTLKIRLPCARIGNESDWIDVASSEYHSLAIKSDGTLWLGAQILVINWVTARISQVLHLCRPFPQ